MKERMTRNKVNARARDLGLEAEVERIWSLADHGLDLREEKRKENTKTIPFKLKGRTVFRVGFEAGEKDPRLAICFPFYAREQNGPWTPGLKTLQEELLEAVDQGRLTLLGQGRAREDPRLELSESSVDMLVEAIRTMYSEVSQNL